MISRKKWGSKFHWNLTLARNARKWWAMSERKKSLFLTKEMWAQDSPPLENSAWNFQRLKCTKGFTRKNDGKSKFDSTKIKIRFNVKNEKQTFLQNFAKNDESMISKKGARSSTVKEIIQERSESDDGWVWDRSFCFMMTSCLCKFGCSMHYFFFGPISGITSSWNLL